MWNHNDAQQFEKASDKVQEAINALAETLEWDNKNAAERETILYFISELKQFQSHDNGEAGFIPFLTRVLDRTR